MIFLIRISRKQFRRRNQYLNKPKPKKSKFTHREKGQDWFFVFHLLSRRGNDLDLIANGAEDLGRYPSEISVLGPNLWALADTHLRFLCENERGEGEWNPRIFAKQKGGGLKLKFENPKKEQRATNQNKKEREREKERRNLRAFVCFRWNFLGSRPNRYVG